jgi:flagellin
MAAINNSFKQLSTGNRITSASVDAAGLSVAEQLTKATRGESKAVSNIGDARGMLNIADGAMSGIADMLGRQRELAVQSANGLLNDSQRSTLNSEFQELSKQIDSVVGSTEFNNQKILQGNTFSIQSGSGSGSQIDLTISGSDTSTLGTAGVDISTAGGAQAAIDKLDNAFKNLNENRTKVGAYSNRLDSSTNIKKPVLRQGRRQVRWATIRRWTRRIERSSASQ